MSLFVLNNRACSRESSTPGPPPSWAGRHLLHAEFHILPKIKIDDLPAIDPPITHKDFLENVAVVKMTAGVNRVRSASLSFFVSLLSQSFHTFDFGFF
jgi:hypothetical protein